jgi:hypothetical protein
LRTTREDKHRVTASHTVVVAVRMAPDEHDNDPI